MANKVKDLLRELEELQARQTYFEEERGSYGLRYFPFVEDFEKEILLEASGKISAIYEEKVRQKIKELAAMYEGKTEKLGYSFTWLTKVKSAADDEETEKILQDWLAELAEKKSAEIVKE